MKRQFALGYLTTAPMEAAEALLLARKVGYYAIGIRLIPLYPGGHFSPLAENPKLLRDTRVRIEETGVQVFDVEGVRLNEQYRRGAFARLLATASELGAKVVTVVGDDPEEQRLTTSFADFCDAAATYHLTAGLEFIPYTRVRDIHGAARILRQVNRPNARLVIDLLHATRSNMTLGDLSAVPTASLGHIQVCDAPIEHSASRESLMHTARRARLLPGEGGIDVRGIVQFLPDQLPLSIEVPNVERLVKHGPEEWSRCALRATERALSVERFNL